MAGGGPPPVAAVPAYEWGEEWKNRRVYTYGQTVVKTFKGREYTYICQVEYSYDTPPYPFLGTVLWFPLETDPEEPQWNGSKAWVTKLNWGDWMPIIPEWEEGEVYRHGHSVTMNGNIYVAGLRYEYLVPPDNIGTTQNPIYYYMRDARQEEQGPLLDVDRDGIRTWMFAARSIKKHRTYQPSVIPFAFLENELYRIARNGVLPVGQRPWYGFDVGEFGPDTLISHPYTNPEQSDAEIGSWYTTGGLPLVGCYSAEFFQHILLKVKDKFAPNGQYIDYDTVSPQPVSEDAHSTWIASPTDRRKIVSWWYSANYTPNVGNQIVFTKPSIYYQFDGTPDGYRNGVDSNWDGDWYYEDKGVLPANKCGVGLQSKSFSQYAWPTTTNVAFNGNEETGAGTWFYQKTFDPGQPWPSNYIQGEDVAAYAGLPIAPNDYRVLYTGLGNSIQNIGRAYGLVYNNKTKPENRSDGSSYYDYDENGNPTSWTDEDGNVNQGTETENGDGTTTWVYTNESGDDVGLPTDDNGDEVEAYKDNWTRTVAGEGRGAWPPRLVAVCYTSKPNPQNVYAPTFKPCIDPPKNDDGDNIFDYNSDGTVTGWVDENGNQNYVVTEADGTFTGYDSNGDEVDLPNDEPYGSPDFYKVYTTTIPAEPPDSKPWLRELYFYFEYNHGVYGDRTIEVEVEVDIFLHSWNVRELPIWNSTIPVLHPTGQTPEVYVWKFVQWRMSGEVELGFCQTGGFRSGKWKKVQFYYWDYDQNQRLPVPYNPNYPNYGYVWDYEPGTDCLPYENPVKKTTEKITKSFKVTADSYASFQFYGSYAGDVPENKNHIYDGAPVPGTGFCKFLLDVHTVGGKADCTYEWRITKVKFPEGTTGL